MLQSTDQGQTNGLYGHAYRQRVRSAGLKLVKPGYRTGVLVWMLSNPG